jgi:hypothetical protein
MKVFNRIVVFLVALLLFAAAAMKAHQILTTIIPSISEILEKYNGFELVIRIMDARELMIFHIPLEIGLGIWLLSGIFRKAGHIAAILTFALFIFVTAYKGINGFTDCGCFGVFKLNPWFTLTVIDIPVFLLLIFTIPIGCRLFSPLPKPAYFLSVAIPAILILASVTVFLLKTEPVKPEPMELTGDVWDKLAHIDISEQLQQGMWVVLLFHQDCPNCKEAIPKYVKIAPDFQDSIYFAFVEVPPYSDEDLIISADTNNIAVGKLDLSRNWLIQTPRIVLLVDSIVIKSWQVEAPSIDEILDSIGG